MMEVKTMKKIYQTPNLVTVNVKLRSHLLDLSAGGTASISSKTADGNAFGRQYNSWDIWGSGDDEE